MSIRDFYFLEYIRNSIEILITIDKAIKIAYIIVLLYLKDFAELDALVN